jgi:hypothetical protein
VEKAGLQPGMVASLQGQVDMAQVRGIERARK